MARKPKNPEYVSKAGLVTRTFTTSSVRIEYVNLDAKEFGEETVTVMKPGTSAILEAKRIFKDNHKGERIQISKAETVEESTKCIAMKEADFIANGFEVKPNNIVNTETEDTNEHSLSL